MRPIRCPILMTSSLIRAPAPSPIKGPLTENEKAFFDETRRRHAELKQELQVFREELTTARITKQKQALTVVIERIKTEIRRLAAFINANDSDRNHID